jgi:hypothetical protein
MLSEEDKQMLRQETYDRGVVTTASIRLETLSEIIACSSQ